METTVGCVEDFGEGLRCLGHLLCFLGPTYYVLGLLKNRVYLANVLLFLSKKN